VYWITGNNGVGKTTLVRSMLHMLKGMDVMCGGVLIPVVDATINSLEAQISYFNKDGPNGAYKLNKPALFAKWSKYASMLDLTQEQADSHNHSDGELQKWLLLYALDTCGSVLILDELLSAITVDIRHMVIFQLLPEFAKDNGKIIMLVAHCNGDISVQNLHRLVLEHSGNTTLTYQ
jgi:ABC-type Mn2+/Zn2+ transport system ATPase subunit